MTALDGGRVLFGIPGKSMHYIYLQDKHLCLNFNYDRSNARFNACRWMLFTGM